MSNAEGFQFWILAFIIVTIVDVVFAAPSVNGVVGGNGVGVGGILGVSCASAVVVVTPVAKKEKRIANVALIFTIFLTSFMFSSSLLLVILVVAIFGHWLLFWSI